MFEEIIPILIIFIAKAMRPFLRKQILNDISDEQYILINTVMILLLLIIYQIINSLIYNKSLVLFDLYNSYSDLNIVKKGIVVGLALLTIFSTLSHYKIDKSDNKGQNAILIKIISTVGSLMLTFYLSSTPLTKDIVYGIILVVGGLYMINNNSK